MPLAPRACPQARSYQSSSFIPSSTAWKTAILTGLNMSRRTLMSIRIAESSCDFVLLYILGEDAAAAGVVKRDVPVVHRGHRGLLTLEAEVWQRQEIVPPPRRPVSLSHIEANTQAKSRCAVTYTRSTR